MKDPDVPNFNIDFARVMTKGTTKRKFKDIQGDVEDTILLWTKFCMNQLNVVVGNKD